MDPPPVYRISPGQLRYMPAFPGARVCIVRIDALSDSKEVALRLKTAVDQLGLLAINHHLIKDSREIDYCLCALEQTLEQLAVADALAVHEGQVLDLEFFSDRLSVERSVCDDDGVRAVAEAVVSVIRAARSPPVEDEHSVAEAHLGRIVTMVRGVTHAVFTVVRGVVRAARLPRVEGNTSDLARARAVCSPRVEGNNSDLAHAACSPRMEGNNSDLARAACSPRLKGSQSLADLARAALGEVRAARARPVLLQDDCVTLQVSSLQGLEDALRAAPPHTRGVWSVVRVLDVRGVAHLSDVADFEHELRRCSLLGWRIPLMKKVGDARRLDAQLVLLNYQLKCLFKPSSLRQDGTVQPVLLKDIEKQAKNLVRMSTEHVMMFQSEIATLPDLVDELLASSGDATVARAMANEGMAIIRRIRAQQVRV